MRNGNAGAISDSVATIDESIAQRMARYDSLPKDCRDAMKNQSFNCSPIGMDEWVNTYGVAYTAEHMRAFDRRHWRDFFKAEFGQAYPDKSGGRGR